MFHTSHLMICWGPSMLAKWMSAPLPECSSPADTAWGKSIIKINKTNRMLYGYTANEIWGRVFDLVAGEVRDSMRERLCHE